MKQGAATNFSRGNSPLQVYNPRVAKPALSYFKHDSGEG